jgi:hypothetical protein
VAVAASVVFSCHCVTGFHFVSLRDGFDFESGGYAASTLLFFACPKKSKQKKGRPANAAFGCPAMLGMLEGARGGLFLCNG